jgi:hypothetical protein
VLAVSVGNETMVEWSTHKIDPSPIMAGYLRKVRSGHHPAGHHQRQLAVLGLGAQGHAETWWTSPRCTSTRSSTPSTTPPSTTGARSRARGAARPGHDRRQLAEAKLQFNDARKRADKLNLGSMPMIIGETGWAAVDTAGGPNLAFRAHPVNQKMYFDGLQAWVAEGRRDARARRPSSTSRPSTSPGSRATTAGACSTRSARRATRCRAWAPAA